MPLSMTPGSSIIVMVQFSDADMAFAEIRAARHSQNSRNPLHAGLVFGASRFTYVTACQVARPPLTDRTRSPRPQRAFTSRLPAPSLPLGITTTWTGLLVSAGLAPAGMAASPRCTGSGRAQFEHPAPTLGV